MDVADWVDAKHLVRGLRNTVQHGLDGPGWSTTSSKAPSRSSSSWSAGPSRACASS